MICRRFVVGRSVTGFSGEVYGTGLFAQAVLLRGSVVFTGAAPSVLPDLE